MKKALHECNTKRVKNVKGEENMKSERNCEEPKKMQVESAKRRKQEKIKEIAKYEECNT